jgi:predicted aminopeptidase
LKNSFYAVAFVMTLLTTTGCESTMYYGQAAKGQWQILRDRQDIDLVIDDTTTPPSVREKLKIARDAREFAKASLKLTSAGGYEDFVEIGRPYVVWNVFAAPEFDTNPVTWCFPIAGCVPYRGYFSKKDAQQYASQLERQGFEVFVGGVEAYSTLGWFDDPILSTFLARDQDSLVALIFHEMSHQHLYVPNDSAFNESYATTVEIEGLRLWKQSRNDTWTGQDPAEALTLRDAFIGLIMAHRDELKALYASRLSDTEKREQKRTLQQKLREDYKTFKSNYPAAGSRFDGWFNRPVNNARLSSLATYSVWVPAFRSLFRKCNGDFDCFHREARAISKLEQRRREESLEDLSTPTSHPVEGGVSAPSPSLH